MAKPTVLTEKVQDIIIDSILNNLPYVKAFNLAGIGNKTFYNWKKRAEEEEERGEETIYTQLFHLIREAESKAIYGHLAAIKEGKTGWQSRSWILERRWREHFANDSYQLDDLRRQLEELRGWLQQISQIKGIRHETKANETKAEERGAA